MAIQNVDDLRNRVEELKAQLQNGESIIAVAKSAGEDVTPLIIKMNNLKLRLQKWEKALADA
jgi:hypothetical protein